MHHFKTLALAAVCGLALSACADDRYSDSSYGSSAETSRNNSYQSEPVRTAPEREYRNTQSK